MRLEGFEPTPPCLGNRCWPPNGSGKPFYVPLRAYPLSFLWLVAVEKLYYLLHPHTPVSQRSALPSAWSLGHDYRRKFTTNNPENSLIISLRFPSGASSGTVTDAPKGISGHVTRDYDRGQTSVATVRIATALTHSRTPSAGIRRWEEHRPTRVSKAVR